MLDHDDLKWIATTSTELNSMLQQISRYADLARQHKGEYNYIEMLGERVELATKTAQSLFDRVTSRILEGSAPKPKKTPDPSRPPEFKVVRDFPEPAAPAKPKHASGQVSRPEQGTRRREQEGAASFRCNSAGNHCPQPEGQP